MHPMIRHLDMYLEIHTKDLKLLGLYGSYIYHSDAMLNSLTLKHELFTLTVNKGMNIINLILKNKFMFTQNIDNI